MLTTNLQTFVIKELQILNPLQLHSWWLYITTGVTAIAEKMQCSPN
jgi:hypothetical protein